MHSTTYLAAIIFGGISVIFCTVVNECPEDRERFLAKTNFCDNSSLYHCLPDEECKLHKICIQPVKSAPVLVILNNKGTLFPKYVISIPYSNIDVYELFSFFVCKLSVQDTVDTKLFDKILQKLNVSVPKATGSYTKPCDPPTTHHYLATLDCKMKKSCNEPRMSPNLGVYIYNESAFQAGRLKLQEFNVGTLNSFFYYRIGFILSTLERIKTYHEEEFDNKGIESWKFDRSDASHTNESDNTELHNPGIVAGIIVSIIVSCIMIALTIFCCWRKRSKMSTIFNNKKNETGRQIHLLNTSANSNSSELQVNDTLQDRSTKVMQMEETHNRTEETNNIETFIEPREVKEDQSQDIELSTDVENKQEDEIRNTKSTSDCDTTEQLQSGKQTVHIRVEDYKPSCYPLNSSNKPLMPRDLDNTVLFEDTKTLSAYKDVSENFCDDL
ncbi:uncharacterized protein LOC127726647 isoform X2 [Mytilus californianus]|nr:uncharacterized protein LOC127726647 isoform X2 [Mytilus californianus]